MIYCSTINEDQFLSLVNIYVPFLFNFPICIQAPMPYEFAYAVKNEPSYNDFGHQESSDGKVVSGSYNVLLPDGRTQTVTYTVSADSGYVAEVKYEGEAKYPEYKAAASYPTSSYPAPAYPSYPNAAYPAPVEEVAAPVAEVVAEVAAEVEATTDSA